MLANLQQFVSVVAAQTPQGGCGGEGAGGMMVPFILMLGILYFVMIRPASKERKVHAQMLESLKRGDEVVTTGGMLGTVADTSDRVITIEIAKNVKVRMLKSSIAKRATDATAEKEEKKDEKPADSAANTSKK